MKKFSEFLDEKIVVEFREVRVTFDNGDVIETSMNPKITDDDINEYYKIGKQFNIGRIDDKMAKVKKVEILK